jgi:hypothetical protein
MAGITGDEQNKKIVLGQREYFSERKSKKLVRQKISFLNIRRKEWREMYVVICV